MNKKKGNRSTSKIIDEFSISKNELKPKLRLGSKKKLIILDAEKENNKMIFVNSHDTIIDNFINQKRNNQELEEFKVSIINLRSKMIVLSKDTMLKLIDRMKFLDDSNDKIRRLNKIISEMEEKSKLTMRNLNEIKLEALKDLINEKFDEFVHDQNGKEKNTDEVRDSLKKLFQKEMLLEQSLNLLTEDNVDINQLLFCAFERIQSENYYPPTGESRFLDGHFEFGDQLKMPTSRWMKDKQKSKEFKLKLEHIVDDS